MEKKTFKSTVYQMEVTMNPSLSIQETTPSIEGISQPKEIVFHLRDESLAKPVDMVTAISKPEALELIKVLQELTK